MSSALNIRTITPADFDQYVHLSNSAFGVPIESERELVRRVGPDQILVVEVDEVITAQVFIHRLGIWVNGKMFSLGGIGGVTTSYDHRHKGYATKLLQKTLEHMYKMGCTMSTLYPTTYPLYYRCGWAIADRGCMFAASPASFGLLDKRVDHRTEHRVINPHDLKLLQNIRHRSALVTQGFIERDKFGWQRRIFCQSSEKDQQRLLVLHYNEQRNPDGYLIYEPKDNNTVEVLECIHNSPDAFDGLVSFVSQNLSQRRVTMWLSVDTSLLSRVVNPLGFEITCDASRQAMHRIVNVAKAISGRPIIDTESGGKFTLQVIDPVAHWNHGTWLIEIEKGKTQCKRSPASSEADVVMNIQTFTQLFVGYCSVNNALTNGFFQLNRLEVLKLLDVLFKSRSLPFSGEHF